MIVQQDLIRNRCERLGLPEPVFEHRFDARGFRRWRFDCAWPAPGGGGVALEIDGGAFLSGGGRHSRGAGMRRDNEKINQAIVQGWRVVRCTPREVEQMAIWATLSELLLAPAGEGSG